MYKLLMISFIVVSSACSSAQIRTGNDNESGSYKVVSVDSTLLPTLIILDADRTDGGRVRILSRMNDGIMINVSDLHEIKNGCWYQLDLWRVIGLSIGSDAEYNVPPSSKIYEDGVLVLDLEDANRPAFWTPWIHGNRILPSVEVRCE